MQRVETCNALSAHACLKGADVNLLRIKFCLKPYYTVKKKIQNITKCLNFKKSDINDSAFHNVHYTVQYGDIC